MEEIRHSVATWQVIAAVVVFLLTYALIMSEKINRAILAIAGAVVMVLLGIVELKSAYQHHIEWETLFLLIGMMIIVGITNKTGLFQYVAIRAAQRVKGNPMKVIFLFAMITFVGSAFLDNVTTVLLMVPITFSITRLLKVNPMPYLLIEIIASNIGGTATLIGDPPNIMIGTTNGLSFNDFLINLTPVVIIIMAVTWLMMKKMYAKDLSVEADKVAELLSIEAKDCIKDPVLMKKCVAVLVLTILGFVFHGLLHTEAAVIAMTGASLLMLIGVKEHDVEEVFHSVEWVSIFFFAGLFVLVGGLVDAGIIKYLASRALEVTSGNMMFTSILILWVSGIASSTIDNIPFVATMIPLIQDMGAQMHLANARDLNPVWWSLALGACLGGNGTLIGASANLVVAGLAAREGHEITYMKFLKVGAPLTFVALAISTVYIYFVYFYF